MEPITATELRKNVYRLLDRVLETGVPLEIERHGRRLLLLAPDGRRRDLDALPRREGLACHPEELIATTWEGEWTPDP